MIFADLALARRLERAEGVACREFAHARARLSPESGATSIEVAGTIAVFDGVDSPVTQTFGLGVFETPDLEQMNRIEHFFLDRGAHVNHEISPHAGIATLDRLCERGYRPIETSNVMFRAVDADPPDPASTIRVRVIDKAEAALWTDVNVRGWTHECPDLVNFLREIGTISTERAGSLCFLAEDEGVPGAVAVLCLGEGVALFGGSTTVPERRRRGLQAALLRERMAVASRSGCDLAMMVAAPGSDSQRNAERRGFRVAYTRTQWRLSR